MMIIAILPELSMLLWKKEFMNYKAIIPRVVEANGFKLVTKDLTQTTKYYRLDRMSIGI